MSPYASTRKQWGARGHGGSPIGMVHEVVIHHQGGGNMSAGASFAQEQQRMRAIDAFHLTVRKWSGGIGYSAVAFPSGRVHEARGYGKSGAHTRGHNSRALAIMMPGDGRKIRMTVAQIRGSRFWIGKGIEGGHISVNPAITGHRDHGSTACPGDEIYGQLSELGGVRGPEDAAPPEPKPEPEPKQPESEPKQPEPEPKPEGDDLRHGMSGDAVRAWQRDLRAWNSKALPKFGADGHFGAETVLWTGRFMVAAKLVSERPSDPVVGPRTQRRMREMLAQRTDLTFKHSVTLRRGHRGAAVAEWQEALRRWNPHALPNYGADGSFGDETVEWTSRFMRAAGLISSATSNPIVGRRTRARMLEALNGGQPPTPPFRFKYRGELRHGSSGAAVREWQRALRAWNPRALPRFGPDGDFGNETSEWTGRFMQATGLVLERPRNPIVGAKTRAMMERTLR